MSKVIAFSIWGDNPAFVDGFLANLPLAARYYPGWTVRIYCDERIPEEAYRRIYTSGATVYNRISPSPAAWDGLFWRFEPAFDKGVEIFISRDCDSRLNPREAAAVNEWVQMGFPFHSMRDHYQHIVPMLGGMWGCRSSPMFAQHLAAWARRSNKGDDQVFLKDKIWPIVRPQCLVHDKYTVDTVVQTDHGPWTYKPTEFFGQQILRPFPEHEPLDPAIHGAHVGARVGL